MRVTGVITGFLLIAVVGYAPTGYSQGLTEQEALSLTADLVLIRYGNGVDNCESMGAKNMPALYDAMRYLGQLRSENLPIASTKFIEKAKSSYRLGLAGLPKPDVTKSDHIKLICERTEDKINQLDAISFASLVQNSVREYQFLFAQAR